MKKQYIIPRTEVFRFQPQYSLLVVSDLNPEDHGGGGEAGGRFLEDDELF